MPRVLVLGAGLVARPLVRYLLAQTDFHVTVADQLSENAADLIGGAGNGSAIQLTVGEKESVSKLVASHDVTVSLLPAQMHATIARSCMEHGKHMVTASYVNPEIEGLNEEARRKGLMILNEVGVDPGLDHMSAMRVIDDIKRRGGNVTRFQSYCGGVPAPEAANNPWGYKMSWSPRGVCMAANSSARFARNGVVKGVEGIELYANPERIDIQGFPLFYAYPNRDSLKYIDLYGLQHVQTMFRGTMRYEGWCETIQAALKLCLFEDKPLSLPQGTTWAQFMAGRAGADPTAPVDTAAARSLAAKKTGLKEDDPVIQRFEWLGLFDNTPAKDGTAENPAAIDYVAAAMVDRLAYAPGERDALVMKHFFVAAFAERNIEEHITSTLVAFGDPDGDSAMAKTVGLPAAVATRLLATGAIMVPGVHIPVDAAIYDPILDELARQEVCFVEKKYLEPL